MKYLNLELEGQMALSSKVYENVDFRKSLLRTEINLGYVGASTVDGMDLHNALKQLEKKAEFQLSKYELDYTINYGECLVTWYKVVRDEHGERVSSVELVSFYFVEDTDIKVPEVTRTKHVADTYLNGVIPKRYGCKSDGTMTKEKVIKWIYHAVLKPVGLAEHHLKEVLEQVKEQDYHLYALHDGMPEVACLIASRTNTQSCMTENGLNSAFAKFRHIRTNKKR